MKLLKFKIQLPGQETCPFTSTKCYGYKCMIYPYSPLESPEKYTFG